MTKVAIIGAGIAGLACAEALQAAGHAVVLFDKSRSAGGRMSTRRLATPLGEAQFDHGAQYFNVRDAQFRDRVERWRVTGVALPWPAAGPDAWVGVPGMTAPAKAMAGGCEVRWSVPVDGLRKLDEGWQFLGAAVGSPETSRTSVAAREPDARFDAVVVALPAEQAAGLLAPIHPAFAAAAGATRSAPCWTLMLAFADRLPVATDIIRDGGAIGWAARNSAKPGRSGPEAWVVQAGPAWSAAHLELPPKEVMAALQREFAVLAGITLPAPLVSAAHRWRYARSGTLGQTALWDAAARLGVCGDWLLGPRVEAAWLSGTGMATRIVTSG